MPNMRNTFHLGAINTDANSRFVKNGEPTSARNTMFDGLGNDGIAGSFRSAVELDLSHAIPDNSQNYHLVGHTKDNYTMYLFFNGGSTEDFILECTTKGDTDGINLVAHSNNLKLREADGNYLSANVVDGRFIYYTFGKYDPFTGELEPTSSPKRFNIADAKANPVTYFDEIDINNILPRIAAPFITKVKGSDIKTSGNFTVVCRIQTKDKEWSPLGYKSNTLTLIEESNTIQVAYTLDLPTISNNQLERIEFYLIQDNTGEAKLVKTFEIDNISPIDYIFTIQGDKHQRLLGMESASIINYESPINSAEQELLLSRIIYSNSELTLPQFDDTQKLIPFTLLYTDSDEDIYHEETGGAWASDIVLPDPSGVLLTNGKTFKFQAIGGTNQPIHLVIDVEFDGGSDYTTNLATAIGDGATVVRTGTDTIITLAVFPSVFPNLLATIDEVIISQLMGLNPYNAYYICNIFYDEYGRNLGASNETELGNIYDPTSGDLVNITTNQTGVITPPPWAKYYSIGITSPVQRYEYYKYTGTTETIDGVIYYPLTNLGLSTSLLSALQVETQQVSFPEKLPTYEEWLIERNKPDNYESFDDYNDWVSNNTNKVQVLEFVTSKEVSFARMDAINGDIKGKVLDRDVVVKNDKPTEFVYIKADTAFDVNGIYVYKVPLKTSNNTSVFYESEKYSITGTTFDGDAKVINVQDTYFGKELPTNYVDVKLLKRIVKTYRPFVRQKQTGITGRATAVHSQNYEASSNYNGLGIFSSIYNNYWDFDIRYGQIKKTVNRSGRLIVIQSDKWSIMPIDERIIQDGGNGIIEKSKNFFNRPQYYMGDFGVGDPASVCHYNDKIYGVDEKNSVLLRLGENGLNVLNGNMSQEIIEAFKDYDNRVFSGYDPNINGVVFSLMEFGKIGITGEAFVYSEKLNSITTKLKGVFIHMINIGTSLYCHRDIALNTKSHSILTRMYGSNEYTGSYAKEEDDAQLLAFVFNDHPSITKTFQSITIEGTQAVKVVLITNLGQQATIQAEDFKLQEGIWYADIPRENNDISGDEMKGMYMKVIVAGMFDEIYAVGCRFSTSSNLPERN